MPKIIAYTFDEVNVSEDWAIVKMTSSKDILDGVELGDEVIYIPKWSDIKMTKLDEDMYELGYRYKRYALLWNMSERNVKNEIVPIYVDFGEEIESGEVLRNLRDLRVFRVNADGSYKELEYYVEMVENNVAKIMVKIDNASADERINIVMYYGAKHRLSMFVNDIIEKYLKSGSAFYRFDGTDAIIKIPSFNFSGSVMSMFAKVRVIEKPSQYSQIAGSMSVLRRILIDKSGAVCAQIEDIDGNSYLIKSNSTIADNKWHIIGFVYDGTTMKVYVDGVLDNSQELSVTASEGVVDFTIGAYSEGTYEFRGDISMVAYYERALTDEEVAGLISGKMPSDAKLLLTENTVKRDSWYDVENRYVASVVGGVNVFRVGKVLEFDGIDDYAILDKQYKFSDFTVVAVVKPSIIYEGTSGMMIINDWSESNDGSWWLAIRNGNKVDFAIYDAINGNYAQNYSVSSVPKDEVSVIVAVKEGNKSKLYINGNLENEVDVSDAVEYGGTNIVIGRYAGGPSWCYQGEIYAVYVYNRALSDKEIAEVTNSVFNANRAGMVIGLTPDTVSDMEGKWKDVSGMGNDFAIYGAKVNLYRLLNDVIIENRYLYFDGVDDYAKTKDKLVLGNQITVVAILRPLTDSTSAIVLTNGEYKKNGWYWWLSTEQWRVTLNESGVAESRIVYGDFTGINVFASTIDRGYVKFYLNGSKIYEADYGMEMAPPDRELVLGNYLYSDYHWKGEIYAVYVYDRILTEEEIASISEDPMNPPKVGLKVWYAPYSINRKLGEWHNVASDGIGLVREKDLELYGPTPIKTIAGSILNKKELKRNDVLWKLEAKKRIDAGDITTIYLVKKDIKDILGW